MIGVLGVGHLANAMLAGLRRSGMAPERILLSPRGKGPALAAAHGHGLARDNEDLVARSDIVLLAVRPAAAATAVAGLPWRRKQLLVSACAGVPLARFAVVPAQAMRVMPMTAAAYGASPTACYPDLQQARALLDPLGPVIPLEAEADFEVATVSAAAYGWAQELIRRTANWSAAQGLEPGTARLLVARTFEAAGKLLAESPEPMEHMLAELITPGGITERGIEVLTEGDVSTAWEAACAAVLAKLLGKDG